MLFSEMLAQCHERDDLLSDEQMTISSLQMKDLLATVESRTKDLNPTAIISSNTLPVCLEILKAFQNRWSFLMLNGQLQHDPSFHIPPFCKRIIGTGSFFEDIDHLQLDQFLKQGENPDFNQGSRIKGPALILKTSGTTGASKYVLHHLDAVITSAQKVVKRIALNSLDRVLIPVPLHHSYGLTTAFLPSMLSGAKVMVIGNTNIIKLIESIRKFKPTVLFATPGLVEMLLRVASKIQIPRVTITAGDRLRDGLFEKYEETIGPMVNLYGSTEMGGLGATPLSGDRLPLLAIEPMEGVVFKTNNPEGTGTIFCKNPNAFEAYLDESGQTISKGPAVEEWFEMKDLGKWEKGKLLIMGRDDDSLNINGVLVSFFELENAIEKACPQLNRVAIVRGNTFNMSGEQYVAVVEARKGFKVSAQLVLKSCKQLIPHTHLPGDIEVWEELPKLPNGKTDRRSVKNRVLEKVN